MRRATGIIAMVLATLLAGSAFAQEDGAAGGRGRRRGARDGAAEGRRGGARDGAAGRRREGRGDRADQGQTALAKVLDELKLSAEKRAQVDQIIKTHRQAVVDQAKEYSEKLRAIRAQIAEARKARDRKKIKELRKQATALRNSRRDMRKSLMNQLRKVLTKEQFEKVKAVMAPRRGRTPANTLADIRRMDITKDQQMAMRKIMIEARIQAQKAEKPEAKVKIIGEAMAKVVKDVLTDAQRKKLKEIAKTPPDRYRLDLITGLDLSPEQQAKIGAIEDTFREAMEKAETRGARQEALKARREGVTAILTKEQLEKVQERRRLLQKREMEISD